MNHPFPVAAVGARLSFTLSLSLAFPRTYHHPRGTIKSQKRATVIYVYCGRAAHRAVQSTVFRRKTVSPPVVVGPRHQCNWKILQGKELSSGRRTLHWKKAMENNHLGV